MEMNELIESLRNEFEDKKDRVETIIGLLEDVKDNIEEALDSMDLAASAMDSLEDIYGLSL